VTAPNIAAVNGLVSVVAGRGTAGVTAGSAGPAWLICPGHGVGEGGEGGATDEVAGGTASATDDGGGGGKPGLVSVSVLSSIPLVVSARNRRVLSRPFYAALVGPPDRADEGATIVIGAGSAGCVLAARLSDDRSRTVTLVEAGPGLGPRDLEGPLGGPDFLAALEVPERTFGSLMATRATGGPSRVYARGRGVGGSSTVNAMLALRGDPELYRSWGWNDTAAAWAALEVPEEQADEAELGAVDHALLAAAPDAERARLTRRAGRRVTAAEASLWPVLERENLVVRVDSPVDRVVFDGRRAIGVLLADGEVMSADRVVLAAGAIHSPAILLRSGVDTTGVGVGLQDHASAPLTLQLRDGAAGAPGELAIGSLLRRDPWQFLPMNHLGAGAPGLGLLMTALMRPKGRAGTVRLSSHDPLDEPLVDFALLDDPRDVAALVAGVRAALELLAAPSFQEIVEEVYVDAFGTTGAALRDDDSIEQWVRSAVGDYVHASSSCAMGTVVDGDGRLVGYDGVSVCDASVFPSIPDVNTHLPTTMLAERLSARWRRSAAS
jgi:choline dehydrogenase-like flavoprotein